ncbi:PKD domain-containing protein [Flavobacterium ginsenosidimutans]|uniref:PKD domain-containing protein n=1 Tax=Flavobacterium ginsenosidimutans TaxID=687844 RepID=UPI000DACA458|nr:PKD domain-containing protein [Flavobacterium ginsenosidimutans]KAF2327995.1 PKD domain-containing protein [Flavobacterium ginsenosidimutans]
MKNYLIKSFALLSIFFVGCSSDERLGDDTLQKPLADFTFKGEAQAPAKIDFENKSTDATDYLWDFGDNETSLEKNPSHTYTSTGNFKVQLIATGPGGTAVANKNITITARPVPTSVKITKITVTEMPFADYEGNKWETGNLQFFIVDDETYKDQTSSQIFKNITKTQLPLTWTLQTPKVISNLSKKYEFTIVKIEGFGGNNIGGKLYATMSDYTTGANAYPASIDLEYDNSSLPNHKVKLTVYLNWQ